MNEITDGCCIISAQSGIDTASPQIGQYTDSFDKIKFLLGKSFDDCTLVIITDIDGHVQVINTDGTTLIKETDSVTGETSLLWNIGANITADSGVVIYQIAAYKNSGEGIESIWYSKEGRLIVTQSISTTDYSAEMIGAYPNLLTRLLVQSDAIKNMVEAFERTKVDAQEGMGLSANSFSDDEKQKLSGIEQGAEVNMQSDWHEDDETSDAFIKNKPRLASVALSGAYSDLLGTPVVDTLYSESSTNAQSGKAVAQAIAALVASSPETLNTLDELAAALGDDPNFATTIMTMLGAKADKLTLEQLEEELAGIIANANALDERVTINSGDIASNKSELNLHSLRIDTLEQESQTHNEKITSLEKESTSHTQILNSHQNSISLIQGQMGDIDLALDGILAIQNSLLGVSE